MTPSDQFLIMLKECFEKFEWETLVSKQPNFILDEAKNLAQKCAGEMLALFGERGLANNATIVQKCIAFGLRHRWSEPAMQMFLVYVSCKGGFLSERQEQVYIREILQAYGRESLLHHHASFVNQCMSITICVIKTLF